ncbi:MAG: rhodanese-like domain-containing protein [Gammaproteobacteria bacterium]|nr:rhodanese-like domain-containing protein [Gammaproteobacteria bacterium]
MSTLVTAAALALTLSAGAHAGTVSPMQVDGATTVDTAKARSLFDSEVAFVDVRKDSDWDAGRIPGAIHLDIKSVFNDDNLSQEVGKDEAVVFYCNGESCPRSANACKMAVGWGFSKVYYYRDGFPAWKAAGNPVE